MSYSPPYQITDKVVELIALISEKIGQVSERSMDSRPHFRKNNRISSIHSSLRIEANSLSLSDVRDVIQGRIVLGPAKEIQEVKNAYAAYEEISSLDPYSLEELERIHGILADGLITEAGKFRTGEEGVFNGDQCIFMAPPARLVPQLMNDLFTWMGLSKNTIHPLIFAAVFHYEFVFIHPFSDGNGRMARLWHTALLAKWKPIFEYIPLESQIEKFQDGYYQAISACHSAGNSNVFIEFILGCINDVLDEVRIKASCSNGTASIYVQRLLELMDDDTPYTSNELLALLGLRSKDALRKNYLMPAIAQGLIEMTIPDKPKSKNQQYKKTDYIATVIKQHKASKRPDIKCQAFLYLRSWSALFLTSVDSETRTIRHKTVDNSTFHALVLADITDIFHIHGVGLLILQLVKAELFCLELQICRFMEGDIHDTTDRDIGLRCSDHLVCQRKV